MKSITEIRNFASLTDTIGSAGQPTRDQLRLVAEAGYDWVVNLAMPSHADSVHDEAEILSGLGVRYVHLPVPWDAPDPEHLRLFSRIMDALEGSRVFVHCVMNYRVSVFLYRYLVTCRGVPEREARSPVFDRFTPEGPWADAMRWSGCG
jgi:protein tyrosine phosphatase (PTP) superfamily phosphohydrolase (DUF442 family)